MRVLARVALCVLFVPFLLNRAHAASQPKVTIHLRVTGSLVATVTLAHTVAPRQIDYGCLVARDTSPPHLDVHYNNSNPSASHPGFSLEIYGYSRSKHQYNGRITGLTVVLALRGQVYEEEAGVADGTIEVQNGGRVGSFRIEHLAYQLNPVVSPKRWINVSGTWHCDTLGP
jgi:hypothetical protein